MTAVIAYLQVPDELQQAHFKERIEHCPREKHSRNQIDNKSGSEPCHSKILQDPRHQFKIKDDEYDLGVRC